MWKPVEYYHLKVDVNSSSVESLYYNKHNSNLWIKFVNGNIAGYRNVPRAIFNEFANAPSVGKYYNYHIKGQFIGLNSNVDLAKAYEDNVVSLPTITVKKFKYEVEYTVIRTETKEVVADDEEEAIKLITEEVSDPITVKAVKRFL